MELDAAVALVTGAGRVLYALHAAGALDVSTVEGAFGRDPYLWKGLDDAACHPFVHDVADAMLWRGEDVPLVRPQGLAPCRRRSWTGCGASPRPPRCSPRCCGGTRPAPSACCPMWTAR
ncbi:hypothetical protein ABT369_18545 [Dactylosporangium sp. NPDC000244]|uniref:hypothetical protein n=1 Tax=Dactylosporangium sp. NPDC000244 TaxID=3154365 RepID=UPI003332CF34